MKRFMVHVKLDKSRGQTLSVEVDASATTDDVLVVVLLAQGAVAGHDGRWDLDGFSLVFAGRRRATGLRDARAKGCVAILAASAVPPP